MGLRRPQLKLTHEGAIASVFPKRRCRYPPAAAYPADRPVVSEDIAKTLYHLMGVEDLEAIDREGRPFNLLPEGRALTELL